MQKQNNKLTKKKYFAVCNTTVNKGRNRYNPTRLYKRNLCIYNKKKCFRNIKKILYTEKNTDTDILYSIKKYCVYTVLYRGRINNFKNLVSCTK